MNTTHALKCLTKQRPIEKFEAEVKIMEKLKGHPHIVEMVHAFEDAKFYNITMELCKGGELTDSLVKSPFSEREAAAYSRQMLSALGHLHKNNIVHRDIKPANFMFSRKFSGLAETNVDVELDDDDNYDRNDYSSGFNKSIGSHAGGSERCYGRRVLKLIDFGTAMEVKPNQVVRGRAGTLHFMAPELICRKSRRKCTGEMLKASDMWSMGVVLYLMVCGRPPFDYFGSDPDSLPNAIMGGHFVFPTHAMSDSIKDLIRRLLDPDPDTRITAREALSHPWVANCADVPISNQVLLALSRAALSPCPKDGASFPLFFSILSQF